MGFSGYRMPSLPDAIEVAAGETLCAERHGKVRQPMQFLFRCLLSVFAMVTLVNMSDAVEAPSQQLWGKSIVVAWSEDRVQRSEGERWELFGDVVENKVPDK